MIYEWRHFTPRSTDLTSIALQFYAPGLMVFCLAKVFVPVFYAIQDTKTPVKIALIAVALNFTMNVAFLLTWPLYLKHAGLALATVISEGFNGITLGFLIHRRLGSPGWSRIIASAAKSLAAAIGMGVSAVAVHAMLFRFGRSLGLVTKLNEVQSVLLSILCALVVYIGLALWFRCPELKDVWEALHKRRKRAPGELAVNSEG